MKPTFEDMLYMYREWLKNPVGTQADFFKIYKWTREDFFHEASVRGIDV